jgi:uracil-DNA glycosylase family 4
MDGFFSASLVSGSNPRKPTLPACGACKINLRCRRPKIPLQGNGGKRILIVLEQPTQFTDATGNTYGGEHGEALAELFARYGIDIKEDCWITHATACRSGSKKDEKANAAHVMHCSPLLSADIKRLQPELIIPMGPLAINSVVRLSWCDDVGETERFQGYRIPATKLNAWICPMTSLSELYRIPEYKRDIPDKVMRKHLRAALKLVGTRPTELPVKEWEKRITVIEDTDEAARVLEGIRETRCVVIDFEANGLKPEYRGMRLYTCAILVLNKAGDDIAAVYAYPMRGAAIGATMGLMSRGNPKIAANMKYEERWSTRILGMPINNLVFDTMLGAHILDNRQGTKGVAFLSYVFLGWEEYKAAIGAFFSKPANPAVSVHINSIDQIDRRQLLLYNGLDDIAEWLLARIMIPRIFNQTLPEFIADHVA